MKNLCLNHTGFDQMQMKHAFIGTLQGRPLQTVDALPPIVAKCDDKMANSQPTTTEPGQRWVKNMKPRQKGKLTATFLGK